MVKSKSKPKRTDARVTISAPLELVEAMRAKSDMTNIPYSRAIQKFLAWWTAGGDLSTLTLPEYLRPSYDGGDLRDLAQPKPDAEKDGEQ